MAAKRLKITSTEAEHAAIKAASQAVNAGQLAIVPMETVYGALARLNHPEALASLRSLRSSPPGSAMALHVANMQQAIQYLDEPNPFAQRLMRRLWPGPVGMVFCVSADRRAELARRSSLNAADLYSKDLITIRCPAHRAARGVLEQCPHPVAGSPPADDASSVDSLPATVLDKVQVILDDGPAAHGKPSTIIRVHRNHFDIVRAGVYDRRIIEKMLQTTILFVCSGNTCRSPMAEVIAKKVLSDSLKIPTKELEKAGYAVLSAGAAAMAGAPASANALIAARELGADLSAHRSRQLSAALVNQATMVFGMSHSHVEAAKALAPGAASKIKLLDSVEDIEDPVGGDVGLYRKLAATIKTLIERRLADGSLLGTEKQRP